MKKITFLSLLIILFLSMNVYAHPGRTDSDGGHTDSSTGKYHYHHGYEAHQHRDGKCPYDYDDKTSTSSSSYQTATKNNTNKTASNISTKSTSNDPPIVEICLGILGLSFIPFSSIFKKK